MKLGVIRTWQAPRCQAAGECEESWEGPQSQEPPEEGCRAAFQVGCSQSTDEGL